MKLRRGRGEGDGGGRKGRGGRGGRGGEGGGGRGREVNGKRGRMQMEEENRRERDGGLIEGEGDGKRREGRRKKHVVDME